MVCENITKTINIEITAYLANIKLAGKGGSGPRGMELLITLLAGRG
jgi:hypothetical protein